MQSIEEILDFIKRKDTNILQLSKETNIPSDRIYSWRRGKGMPKAEDTTVLLEWAKRNGESTKSNMGKEPIEEPEPGHADSTINKLVDMNLKLTDTLQTFANSQQTFANSQQSFADSHKNISSTNERLSRMLQAKAEHELERSLEDANAKLLIFQEVLQEYAMRDTQINIADVLPAVNKRFQDYVVSKENKERIQNVQGNSRKSV